MKELARARKAHVPGFHFVRNPSIEAIVKILATDNFILSYAFQPGQVHIFLHKKNRRDLNCLPFDKIPLFSTSAHTKPIRFSQLPPLKKNDPFSLYLLSTPKGIRSHTKAIQQKTGGLLLARIGY